MRPERDVDRNGSGQRRSRRVEREVAALAAAQHGVVTRTQLRALGLTRDQVDWRVACGRLHPVHRGVYAAGHPVLSRRGRRLAAVLAAGPGAVLSHRAAADEWGIRQSDRLEMTCEARPRPFGSVVVHQGRLRADEVEVLDGVPTTTVHRTLLDLAAVVPRPHLERALAEVERQRLTDPVPLGEIIARHRGRRGIAILRAVLADRTSPGRSELERRFAALVRRHGLRRPELNRLVCGFECDAVWADRRVIVELDGASTHGGAVAFERDRARDRRLHAAGWLVIRVTWRQLRDEPESLVADIRALLDRRTRH